MQLNNIRICILNRMHTRARFAMTAASGDPIAFGGSASGGVRFRAAAMTDTDFMQTVSEARHRGVPILMPNNWCGARAGQKMFVYDVGVTRTGRRPYARLTGGITLVFMGSQLMWVTS